MQRVTFLLSGIETCPNLEMTEGQYCGWDVFVFCVYVGGLNKGLMNVEHRCPCSFVSQMSTFSA